MNKKIILVTVGDIEGIGIHLFLKEFFKKKLKNFILVTNIKIFREKTNFPLKKIHKLNNKLFKNLDDKKINIYDFKTKNKHTNTLDSLNIAYSLSQKNNFIGILTLPINKYKINKFVDKKFIDQTSFFSKKENQKNSNMIFYYKNKFFVPLTIHIELKNVYKQFINKDNIIKKIENLFLTLKKDFKIQYPKILIAGINPHAGENNSISYDEKKYLNPIVKILKNKKIDITGPISGDAMINKKNLVYYDAFLFTFHDQALIPFKMISNYKGVNYTSGLKIIRTSPSHGTAENLVGKNIAISLGVVNSFKLIKKIHKNRN